MTWPQDTINRIKRLANVRQTLKGLYVDRDLPIDLLVLSAVSQEHLLLLGLPGTAKTDLINRFTGLIQAQRFSYLLSRFTEPTEVFGPLSLPDFQKGTFKIVTAGMLPEAQIAFLDEVFQGSSAILNGFLTLIHERVFYNGSVRQSVPLLSLIGASNTLPDDAVLKAFADRFVLRAQVDPVPAEMLDQLLDRGWTSEMSKIEAAAAGRAPGTRELGTVTVEDLRELHGRLGEVNNQPIRATYADIVKQLRAEGVDISDRRVVKGLKLISGATLLRQADTSEPQDLWPLYHIWTRTEDVTTIRQVVEPHVAEAGGPAVRAGRPVTEIEEDLNVLDGQGADLRREGAIVTHLGRYNDLRREARRDHAQNAALLGRIDRSIGQLLERLTVLETGHV
jgi:MoxR-like ATPase